VRLRHSECVRFFVAVGRAQVGMVCVAACRVALIGVEQKDRM
jgi:hypothetical protein